MNGQQGFYPNYSYSGFQMPNYGQRTFIQPQQAQSMQIVQPTTQPQPQIQQSLQYQSPIQGFYFSNETEAKAFVITQPNTSLVFVDRPQGKAFLKSTDNMCESTTRYFNLVETDENGKPLKTKKQEGQNPQIDFGQFVNREQLKGFVTLQQYEKLTENYKFLEEQMRIMQKQLNGGKASNGMVGNK